MAAVIFLDQEGVVTRVLDVPAGTTLKLADGAALAPEGTTPDDVGRHYDIERGTFGERIRSAATRRISRDQLLDRITIAEGAAIRRLAEGDKLEPNERALLTEFVARVYARDTFDLDEQGFVAGLALVQEHGVPSVWPDAETAAARIAYFRS